jgi:hypothetical protein
MTRRFAGADKNRSAPDADCRGKSARSKVFEHDEQRLHPFIAGKQKTAVQFVGSFAPKTRLGLFFRNQISKSFELPFVVKLAMGQVCMIGLNCLTSRAQYGFFMKPIEVGAGIYGLPSCLNDRG